MVKKVKPVEHNTAQNETLAKVSLALLSLPEIPTRQPEHRELAEIVSQLAGVTFTIPTSPMSDTQYFDTKDQEIIVTAFSSKSSLEPPYAGVRVWLRRKNESDSNYGRFDLALSVTDSNGQALSFESMVSDGAFILYGEGIKDGEKYQFEAKEA